MVCEIGKEAVPPERATRDVSRLAKPFLDSHMMNKTMTKAEMKRYINETRNTQQAEKLKASKEQQGKAKKEHKRQQSERDKQRVRDNGRTG